MELIGKDIYKIEKVDLLSLIMDKKNSEYRLCQICCAFVDNQYEISYSFAKEMEVEHYRLVVDKDEAVPSISRVYRSAIFYENEMKELWGLNVEHMKVDYDNKLYRINVETPFIEKTEGGAN